MRLRIIVTLFVLNSIVLFSQVKTVKHTITKGETISSIAEQYDIKQSAIFKLNPKAKNVLKLNSILLIPVATAKKVNTKIKPSANFDTKEHEVLAKETPYGIAKQYGISLKELNEANPTLAIAGLQIGQKLVLPSHLTLTNVAITGKPFNIETRDTETITVAVLPKESKYSIARKYGITINDLDSANPALGSKLLQVGQQITIPGNATPTNEIAIAVQENVETTTEKKETVLTSDLLATNSTVEEIVLAPKEVNITPAQNIQNTITAQNNSSEIKSIIREVLPKETKYGIAKEFGLTVKELENQNPSIKNTLRVGDKLTIRPNIDPIQNNVIASVENNPTIENTTIDLNTSLKPTFNHNFLDQLIERAAENIGTRYRTGGTSKAGFDCSGLMCSTFEAFDIKLPRTSREQSGVGTKISTEQAQKGDLIFFKTNGRSQINHVGMVVEVCDGEIKFIHSSVSNGVIISSTKEKYYEKNFTQINRVLQ